MNAYNSVTKESALLASRMSQSPAVVGGQPRRQSVTKARRSLPSACVSVASHSTVADTSVVKGVVQGSARQPSGKLASANLDRFIQPLGSLTMALKLSISVHELVSVC